MSRATEAIGRIEVIMDRVKALDKFSARYNHKIVTCASVSCVALVAENTCDFVSQVKFETQGEETYLYVSHTNKYWKYERALEVLAEITEQERMNEKGRNTQKEGLFVHVLNEKVKDWEEYLLSFLNIDGEVCASYLEENLYSYRKNTVGILLKGKTNASFTFDCWSRKDMKGYRRATYRGNEGRSEHWVVPSQMQPVAIVVRKYDKEVFEAAAALGLKIQYLKCKW